MDGNGAGGSDGKATLFRGFSDGSRLAILESLRSGPRAVGEIVEATGLSQSNTSNHLACLHDCGLVAREQRGRRVIYALSDDRVAVLLGLADSLLADVARGVYECARYGLPAGDGSGREAAEGAEGAEWAEAAGVGAGSR